MKNLDDRMSKIIAGAMIFSSMFFTYRTIIIAGFYQRFCYGSLGMACLGLAGIIFAIRNLKNH